MAELDINAILATLDNLPRSTPNNPYYITPPVGNSIAFSKPKIAQSNQPNFFNFPIPSSQPSMRNSILDTNNNQPNMSGANALTEKGLLNSLTPMPNNANNPNIPPNYKNNLLNLAVSPQGQAFVAGIDTRSSNVPMSIIERLQPGYQAYLKSKADQSKLAYEKMINDRAYELDVFKAETDRINSKPDQYRPLTPEEKIKYGIKDDKAYRFNITQQKPEIIGGSGTTINMSDNIPGFEESVKYAFGVLKDKQEKATGDSGFKARLQLVNQALNDGSIETSILTEKFLPLKEFLLSQNLLTQEETENLNKVKLIQALGNYFVPRMRAVGSGSSSDYEQAMYKLSTISVDKPTEVNKILSALMLRIADYDEKDYALYEKFLNQKLSASEMPIGYEDYRKQNLGSVIPEFSNNETINEAFDKGTIKKGDIFFNLATQEIDILDERYFD